jgi:hypothetical protein
MQIGSLPIDYTASSNAAQGVTPPPPQPAPAPAPQSAASQRADGDHDHDHDAGTTDKDTGQQVNVVA